MRTVVPVRWESMVTSCIKASIKAMPLPRCSAGTSARGFHVPESAMVTNTVSGSAVAHSRTVPSGRSRWPCSMELASASPTAISTSSDCSCETPTAVSQSRSTARLPASSATSAGNSRSSGAGWR